ncbi:hypothetical protein LBMAG21_15070 [Armatimonadota bacterium]|nr:hypothetical protein LBMAG21_15070 [Armatimonadota bacterium]
MFGPVVRITYGKSEIINPITVLPPSATDAYYTDAEQGDGVCVGWPGTGVEIQIRDETGTPLPVDTVGEVFLRGVAGERFGVRNSGATAVVEGAGDHCCEYMTGGVVVVLGKTGRNFAAGMSGGVAYVWDKDGNFKNDLNDNHGLITLETVSEAHDVETLHTLISRHLEYTRSDRAAVLLQNWATTQGQFKKVISKEYLRAQAELASATA